MMSARAGAGNDDITIKIEKRQNQHKKITKKSIA